jgi:SAM-dependent methyltransferase
MNCPLCQTALREKIDDAYFVCRVCKGIALRSDLYLSINREKERYKKHNNDVNDVGYMNFTSPIWQYVLNNINKNHSGLDYGCGDSSVIYDVLMKNGFQVARYDPFFFPDTRVLQQQYNYIMACEVIEHFHRPAKEFSRLRNMLLPGGELLCMTHIYDPTIDFSEWYYRRDPTHVFIYQKETIAWIKAHFSFSSLTVDNRLISLKNAD